MKTHLSSIYGLITCLFLSLGVNIYQDITIENEMAEIKAANVKLTNDIDKVKDNNDKLLSHGTETNEAREQLSEDTAEAIKSILKDILHLTNVIKDTHNIMKNMGVKR